MRRLRGVEARLGGLEIGARQQVPRGQVLRAIQLLLRVGELGLRAHHGRDVVERRQVAAVGGAVAGARLVERRALAVGAVLKLLGIQLEERRTRGDAIAEVVHEPRDASRHFGADDNFFPGGQRADDVDLAAHVADLRGFGLDDGGLLAFGSLDVAIAGACRGAQTE